MQNIIQNIPQTEWIKILSNGLITIPKVLREKAGFKEGDVARAWLEGNKIVIEPRVDYDQYELYSDEEIARWMELDALSPELQEKFKDLLNDLP